MTALQPVAETLRKAARLTPAQWTLLSAVCRSNGGGVRIRCKVTTEGEAVPPGGPMRRLFDKGLIQGKAGDYETVVHTKPGLALFRSIIAADASEAK